MSALSLDQFARGLSARFGSPVWLVGSYLTAPEEARDVDLRIVLPDAAFAARYASVAAWGAGETSQRLLDDAAHLNMGGSLKTGLNLDLQIWPRSYAERAFPEGKRRLLAAPRIANWDHALLAFLHAEAARPYVWGETDCGSLVRRATAVIFGVDLFEHVPAWSTKRGAVKVQSATGGVRTLMLELGAHARPLVYAHSGDIVVGPEEDGFPFAGVVIDGRVLTASQESGVGVLALADCPAGSDVLRWHG